MYRLDSSGPVAASCEHGNEPLGSIKEGNFLTTLPYCPFQERPSSMS
jgi:hypothetical protein